MSDYETYQCPCGRNHPAGVECAIGQRSRSFAASAGSALARCPFCGSAKVYVRLYNQPSVCCETCLAMGPATVRRLNKDNQSELQIEAAKRWNKRVDYSHKVTLEAQNAPAHRPGRKET